MVPRSRVALIRIFAGAVASFLAAASLSAQQVAQDSAAQVARGKRVYHEQRCRVCHAIAGEGNRRYPLDGVGSRLSADTIRLWIVAPREVNPNVRKRAYDQLSADDLQALVAFLRGLREPRAPGS